MSTSGSDINANQLIDYYVVEFNTNQGYITSLGSTNIANWQGYPLVPGYLNGNRTRSSFICKVQLLGFLSLTFCFIVYRFEYR